jgi:hypothetical protein
MTGMNATFTTSHEFADGAQPVDIGSAANLSR